MIVNLWMLIRSGSQSVGRSVGKRGGEAALRPASDQVATPEYGAPRRLVKTPADAQAKSMLYGQPHEHSCE